MLPNVTAEAMHKIAMKKNSMRFMPIVMFFPEDENAQYLLGKFQFNMI
jgi:hypothetical protein